MRETIVVISLVVKVTQQKHLKGENEPLSAHSSRGYSPSWREVKAAGVVGSWSHGIHSQKTALIAGAQFLPSFLSSPGPRLYSGAIHIYSGSSYLRPPNLDMLRGLSPR